MCAKLELAVEWRVLGLMHRWALTSCLCTPLQLHRKRREKRVEPEGGHSLRYV